MSDQLLLTRLDKENSMMKTVKRSILMILMVGLLLWGCSNAKKEITFANNQFQITKPGSWVVMNRLQDGADIEIGNIFKEAYLIVFSESKLDFDDWDAADYSATTRGFIKESLSEYTEVSGPSAVTVGDLKGIQYEIIGSLDQIKLKYLHTTLESREHFHQIVAWSLLSKYDSNLSDYQSTILSFEEL
jgi:hypothetical protein